MDILKTVKEIGFFETGYNLTQVPKTDSLIRRIERDMPFPGESFVSEISAIPEYLKSLGKSKYLFLTPEIALIERLSIPGPEAEAIIVIPSDMDGESVERLSNNLPSNMTVSLLQEPCFPDPFLPYNGVIVACGYMAGSRPMVLQETYRLINHYCDFHGQMIFIPYVTLPNAVRYYGWLEANYSFSTIWRQEND